MITEASSIAPPRAAALPVDRPLARYAAKLAFALGLLVVAQYGLYKICSWRALQPFAPGLDPLLQNAPRWDWTRLLSEGYVLFQVAVFSHWLRYERASLPFNIGALGLMMAVRDVFVWLTPVSALAGFVPLYSGGTVTGIQGFLCFDEEIFFSGHTGAPFLYALLSKGRLRLFCLAVTALNGAGVMLTRNHYSIDVLGALFIVPTVLALSHRLLGWLKQ